MSNISLCVGLIIFITMVILYVYYQQENNHKYQIAKIKALEHKYSIKNKELEKLKTQTESCSIKNLNDPRSCYFGSNYSCSWNEQIGRCDAIV